MVSIKKYALIGILCTLSHLSAQESTVMRGGFLIRKKPVSSLSQAGTSLSGLAVGAVAAHGWDRLAEVITPHRTFSRMLVRFGSEAMLNVITAMIALKTDNLGINEDGLPFEQESLWKFLHYLKLGIAAEELTRIGQHSYNSYALEDSIKTTLKKQSTIDNLYGLWQLMTGIKSLKALVNH